MTLTAAATVGRGHRDTSAMREAHGECNDLARVADALRQPRHVGRVGPLGTSAQLAVLEVASTRAEAHVGASGIAASRLHACSGRALGGEPWLSESRVGGATYR